MVDLFEIELEQDEWEVLTPGGWQDFKGVGKTHPVEANTIHTINGKKLRCAKDHRVAYANGAIAFADDLLIAELIKTENGIDAVSGIEEMPPEPMYDLLDVNGAIYYTNGLASHNSTTMGAISLWYTLFHSDYKIAFLANKDDVAKEQMTRIKTMYENLPMWIKQGVTEYNKHTIGFENGSRIVVAPTSASSIRGFTFNLVVLDEFAHVPFNIQQEFMESVYPTIASGETSKIAITSTPLGMERFYKIWQDGTSGHNGYKCLKVEWNDVPGRNEKFRQETISNNSEKMWRQEFACEFLGSDDTLIDPNVLSNMAHKHSISNHVHFNFYEEPKQDHKYILLVDTSEGLGKDYSTIQIVDITQFPYIQVGSFRNNKQIPALFPNIIVETAMKYNEARILIETNDIGGQVALLTQQHETGAGMLVYTANNDGTQIMSEGFGPKRTYPGLKMTKATKRIGCSSMKTLLEQHHLIINDFHTIQELSTFVEQTNGTFSAREGHHDDMVMPFVLLGWLVNQPYFKHMSDTDFIQKLQSEMSDEDVDNYFPFGFISSGNDDGLEDFWSLEENNQEGFNILMDKQDNRGFVEEKEDNWL